MYGQHLVRLGALGQVGRFAAVDGVTYPRNRRVICRTSRGLEVGEILTSLEDDQNAADGAVLRAVTVEDDLLIVRQQRNRDDAYQACSSLLAQRGIDAVLVDVEQIFDGGSLYFYFLGEVTPEVEALTGELASAYEAKVQFQQFADLVTAGCGPACGTEQAAGCGSAGCSTCAAAGACSTRGDS